MTGHRLALIRGEGTQDIGKPQNGAQRAVRGDSDRARAHAMARHPAGKGRTDAQGRVWFWGVCDGCPSGKPQSVTHVSGEWGAATVCVFHVNT